MFHHIYSAYILVASLGLSLVSCICIAAVIWHGLSFQSNNCGFLDVQHQVWREEGSVITCTSASGPCQRSLSGPNPSELTATFYCLISYSSNLKGQVPVFTFPKNRVVQLYPLALGCLLVASKKNLIISSRWESDIETHGSTDRQSQLNFNFNFMGCSVIEVKDPKE
jgi:hypothetical protein